MSRSIARAVTDEEIAACHPVMAQLRPHVPLEGFVRRVRAMEAEGYRVAFLAEDGVVRAVAGYRVMDMLAHGRVLYVDDLVTDAGTRSRGHGAALLDWLRAGAVAEGCDSLQLDSGVHRHDAHRFYLMQRMRIASYHFALDLPRQAP